MRFRTCWAAEALLTGLLLAAGNLQAEAAAPADLRLNEIQVLGSHNSYKLAMDPERMASLRAVNPALADSLDYAHVPLPVQLDSGLRKLELDVFYDPTGTLFERREGPSGASAFPVLHVQNLDDRSHCSNLQACLAQVMGWSARHPDHLPIFISFNAKDQVIEQPDFLRPEPFDDDAWTALDEELRAALGERLLTPGQVFAEGELRWPRLSAARGKVVTILDEAGRKRDGYAARWRDRVMFANLPAGSEGAAILIMNDPLEQGPEIRRRVQQGYIVRTRADADTVEARQGDTRRRDAALASGAQLVSTDYYLPAPFGTGYRVSVPGEGIARCNPVLTEGCTMDAVPARD